MSDKTGIIMDTITRLSIGQRSSQTVVEMTSMGITQFAIVLRFSATVWETDVLTGADGARGPVGKTLSFRSDGKRPVRNSDQGKRSTV